ncbi:hypothetical protein [Roseiterribacter gracilis]|uniref:DUF3108 domain-containing protein n=1 Tax=Roseiterribacter gracilis TaxID=2812848 RepID=A0A8S8XA29_9PROT|nr:hypothetical protein TMPK1_07060 [Rhodospirillales bacterium TMPK1]
MHETIRGSILYTSRKPDRMGHERGREQFTIIKHRDGRRSLQAHAEIDDAPNVLRLVTTSVDAAWNPTDASVRLSVGDEFVGSSWYRFTDKLAECEGFTAREGRISQRYTLDRPIGTLGAHPIQGDAWHLNRYDLSQGPGRQRLPLIMMTSLDHRGATGPMLLARDLTLNFVGPETVTVGAGTFEALHFKYGTNDDYDSEDPSRHPPYHVWTTADGDYIFLKGQVAGYMKTYYELMSLERVISPAK